MMNISKEELSRKIVQYIASEINAMDCVGDLKFNITPKEKQKHYRDWAQQALYMITDAANERYIYIGQFDGSSKPNPGAMKIGGYIKNLRNMRETLYTFSLDKGEGTNNRAEYLALIELLEMAIRKGIKRFNIYGDSKLAVMQVNGKWKANAAMAPYRDQVLQLLEGFDHCSLSYIPRAFNAEADLLTR